MMGGARVLGYHGTSRTAAQTILENGFRSSENTWDWLGRGIYFFEENVEHARRWARDLHVNEPAVIGAVIDLSGVLDLNQQRTLEQLRTTAEQLEANFLAVGKPLPVNRDKNRRFDNLLVNFLCDQAVAAGVTYRVVRGLFEEGPAIHRASGFRRLTHIQLAVRDPEAILGTWPVAP